VQETGRSARPTGVARRVSGKEGGQRKRGFKRPSVRDGDGQECPSYLGHAVGVQ
jgi:hypothetical protein